MSRTWSKRSLGNLRGLHPDLKKVLEHALQNSPIDFVVIEGLRNKERQKQLVAEGASRTMNSRHLTGHAADLMALDSNGKGSWDWPLYNKLGAAVKASAKELDIAIVWGGDWKSFKDGPHFELDRKVYPVSDWVSGDPAPEPRTSVAQSKTVQASVAQIASGAATAATSVGYLDGNAQIVLIVVGAVIVFTGLWIMRERIHKWAAGDK